MKLHLYLLVIFIFSSCNFLGNNNTSKIKATRLLTDITSHHTTLLLKINKSISRNKVTLSKEITSTNIELNALDYTISSFHQDWIKGFENFEKQQPFLNYDLQVIRLEQLEKSLKKLEELVERTKDLEEKK